MGRIKCAVFVCGLISLFATDAAEAGWRHYRFRCGGCADPCGFTLNGGCATTAGCATAPNCTPVETGSIPWFKIVMVPKYVTVPRFVCSTEYKDEERQRAVTVYKLVPVQEERQTTETTWVNRTETKTIEYMATVPVKTEKTHEVRSTVPVWSTQEENYTVKVPVLKEASEEYTVKVPVLTDVSFQYVVNVPQASSRTVMRSITNVVPVTKTRTVDHCVPVVRTSLVNKDYGHWEDQVVDVTAGSCGPRGAVGCVTPAAPPCASMNRKVWVPKIMAEEVAVVDHEHRMQEIRYTCYEEHEEQVPFQCPVVCYKPETRTATKKCVSYQVEKRTRPRTLVEYTTENRTRTKKILTFREETRSETYPVISYAQEKRTKEISYTVKVPESQVKTCSVTRYDRVAEQSLETYICKVPVPVVKQVQVQVCQMVPEVVNITIEPCNGSPACAGCAPAPAVPCCR